jgi:transcriptional regulator with XRE-family HTH domain
MTLPAEPSPAAFGSALRAAREEAGVTLEAIAERTKIARAVLAGLEEGDFSRLPGGVFPRLFLRQYLELIHADPGQWLDAFDRARGAAPQSRSAAAAAAAASVAPPRPRLLPWLIGLALVVVALGVVVLIDRGTGETPGRAATPTVAALLLAPTPTPVPTAPPVPTPDPAILVIRAVARPCWVEARVAGRPVEARLLEAGAVWEIAAGGGAVALTLGDAGAGEVDYLGQSRRQLGADGAVVRLTLGPADSL